jgi:hypothetical protein
VRRASRQRNNVTLRMHVKVHFLKNYRVVQVVEHYLFYTSTVIGCSLLSVAVTSTVIAVKVLLSVATVTVTCAKVLW